MMNDATLNVTPPKRNCRHCHGRGKLFFSFNKHGEVGQWWDYCSCVKKRADKNVLRDDFGYVKNRPIKLQNRKGQIFKTIDRPTYREFTQYLRKQNELG